MKNKKANRSPRRLEPDSAQFFTFCTMARRQIQSSLSFCSGGAYLRFWRAALIISSILYSILFCISSMLLSWFIRYIFGWPGSWASAFSRAALRIDNSTLETYGAKSEPEFKQYYWYIPASNSLGATLSPGGITVGLLATMIRFLFFLKLLFSNRALLFKAPILSRMLSRIVLKCEIRKIYLVENN